MSVSGNGRSASVMFPRHTERVDRSALTLSVEYLGDTLDSEWFLGVRSSVVTVVAVVPSEHFQCVADAARYRADGDVNPSGRRFCDTLRLSRFLRSLCRMQLWRARLCKIFESNISSVRMDCKMSFEEAMKETACCSEREECEELCGGSERSLSHGSRRGAR